MGEHKNNPMAIAASRGTLPREETLVFELETKIEPNAKKKKEIQAAAEAAKKAGEDPRLLRFELTNDDKDFVVYNTILIARPSVVATNPNQIPVARIRYSEHIRIPMRELSDRADAAFSARGGDN